MTYQGERARELVDEPRRVFEVLKVRLSADDHVRDVLWGQVGTATDHEPGLLMEASAAEVVDAIHGGADVVAVFEAPEPHPRKRALVVTMQADGTEHIAFAGPAVPGRELVNMDRLDAIDPPEGRPTQPRAAPSRARGGKRKHIHAVSKVRLDADGRITDVFWGRVDPARNDWASPEVVAPVAQVVDALRAGHQVFALFPSEHGHLPDRQFVVADYDGARRTIVLDGPAAYEREVHDMDRLAD